MGLNPFRTRQPVPQATLVLWITHPPFSTPFYIEDQADFRSDHSRSLAPRLPPRRSLAHIGVPDHRDALAIYLRWVRQRYYLAKAKKNHNLPQGLSTCSKVQFDMARISNDVFGAVGGFEADLMPYASEIDLVG